MKELYEYMQKHAERGECRCGKCLDRVEHPEQYQPGGHTADVVFFKVAAKADEHGTPASADELKALVKANVKGAYGDVDLFDGKEHNYLELGGWIGDQGAALTLMGLGTVLGLWRLLTPSSVFGNLIPDDLKQQLAGAGMIAVTAHSDEHKTEEKQAVAAA